MLLVKLKALIILVKSSKAAFTLAFFMDSLSLYNSPVVAGAAAIAVAMETERSVADVPLLGRKRIGHARFRGAPSLSTSSSSMEQTQERELSLSSSSRVYCPTPIKRLPPLPPYSRTISFSSSRTEDVSSSSSSLKRKLHSSGDTKCRSEGSCGECHCTKRRKSRMKRVVRIPAISLKMAEIPPDEYSWRKYGQKPIKGSPHPRGYYRCSSMKNCPARKQVERAQDDPTMMVITYEGEHSHSQRPAETTVLNILESS